MELSNINAEKENFIEKDQDKYRINNTLENKIIFTNQRKRKLTDIPFIIYIVLFTFIIFIMNLIIYLIFKPKYKKTYTYEENAYTKPKYSSHNYSSITFENGLKLVLIQVDPDDKAGAGISFDYGYLDNKFEPGYLELAFISLINSEIEKSDFLTYYFGTFDWVVEKFYSSFYFDILGNGFKNYLKIFSELTYLNDNDERFNNIGNKDLSSSIYHDERKNHLLEYLIYGYKNSQGEDIIPEDYNDIKGESNINYTSIKNIMRTILNNPSKIKIVLYSHYKMSYMKKIFLNYFNDIIHKPKINNDIINTKNAYNISEFSPKKIIYYKLYDFENNFIEINYFLTNKNATYNQLIKDSNYLLYITYILNQTNEGSLYYDLNHAYNDIKIKKLSSQYEIVLKNKIKFSIKVGLNHYSYKYIPEIISKVYNYMNNIKLYINYYNKSLSDIRIEELQIITDQIFTFTEDAHESIFFKDISTDLFYKDEKDFLLKQLWFSKENFNGNINTVKYYFNQLTFNNSVILIGINEKTINKYNLTKSNIAFLFQNIKQTKYFYLYYSLNDIDEYIKIFYDNNFTTLLNPDKNEYISKYDYNSVLEYIPDDYDNYFKTIHEEISNESDNYFKFFFKKDTSFHIPKVLVAIYFFHPFSRPNFSERSSDNDDILLNNSNKNHKLFFEYLLYFVYIKRTISEQLADAFRAGGNYFSIFYNENFFFMEFFIFSDKAYKVLSIINNIIYNQTDFKIELDNRFEMYRDMVFEDFLWDCSYDPLKIENTFYKVITEDKENNLPPIYNYCNFPIDSFLNIKLDELDIDEILTDVYAIKYIYLFGYFNKTEAVEIYKLFNSTNNFEIPLKNYANFNGTKINVSNYVEWAFEKPLMKKGSFITINDYYAETNRFMYFIQYTLKNSILIDMLIDILKNDKNFIDKNIEIVAIKQTNIFIGYSFKDKVIKNEQFMKDIIYWLIKNENMTKKVDIIGDRFYYLLKGYKKVKSLTHHNIVEGARQISYDHLYKTFYDNDISDFKIDEYESFIKEIKKLIYPSIPFVEIVSKK